MDSFFGIRMNGGIHIFWKIDKVVSNIGWGWVMIVYILYGFFEGCKTHDWYLYLYSTF
jgi:hypothetical protein